MKTDESESLKIQLAIALGYLIRIATTKVSPQHLGFNRLDRYYEHLAKEALGKLTKDPYFKDLKLDL